MEEYFHGIHCGDFLHKLGLRFLYMKLELDF